MADTKKFISPNAWFSIEYPADWNEFEDGEGSFLFYNPNEWNGNFRISGTKGESAAYGAQFIAQELRERPDLHPYDLKNGIALYDNSHFELDEKEFTSHRWVCGVDDMSFVCTFTDFKGNNYTLAESIINSLTVRDLDARYPAEYIPIRLSEIFIINEAYEWVVNLVKEQFSVDFQGEEEDLAKLDQVKEADLIGRKRRKDWQALGLAAAVILANEVEGMEWHTLIDGNREDPVLLYIPTNTVVDPMKLVWSRIRADEDFTIAGSYQEALASLHK